MGKERTYKELEVFHLFAQASGLSISESSVEKRRPPEPDILFHDFHNGQRAFDLVELLDEDFVRMTGLVTGTKIALHAFYEGLPQDDKLFFTRKYHNALLYFSFLRIATFNQRKSCLPDIFSKLITLPDEVTGEALKKDADLSSTLAISRADVIQYKHLLGIQVGSFFNIGFSNRCSKTILLKHICLF